MRMEDMVLISVDDHFVEPADMFDELTPEKFKDVFPKMVRTDEGQDAWLVDGRLIKNFGLNAVVGREKAELGMEPTALDQLRKGCYDVHARIEDMNANGLWGSMNFPSFIGMAAQNLVPLQDKALATAIVKAHNDWHIDVWCAAYPERFIPLCTVPIWDPFACAEEIRRVAAKGCHAVSFPQNIALTNADSLHSPVWNPFWKACEDNDVVVCLHFSDNTGASPSEDTPIDAYISNMQIGLFATATDLTFSHILRDFPGIRFALSEGSTGWIPFCMERMDRVHKQHGAWTRQDFGGKMPSEVFKEHVYTCFITDPIGIRLRDIVGIENMTYECDYPHADCLWPQVPEELWKEVSFLTDREIDLLTYQNAMRQYSWNPFEKFGIKREEATVGALRAKAAHVDLTLMSGRGGEPPSLELGPVRMKDVRDQLNFTRRKEPVL